jgi:hypothetical protein
MKYQIIATLKSFKGSAACDPEYQSARSVQFDARLLCTNNALPSYKQASDSEALR